MSNEGRHTRFATLSGKELLRTKEVQDAREKDEAVEELCQRIEDNATRGQGQRTGSGAR